MHSTHAVFILCSLAAVVGGCAYSPEDTSYGSQRSTAADSGPRNNYGYQAPDSGATQDSSAAPDSSENPDSAAASFDSAPPARDSAVVDSGTGATCQLTLGTGIPACDTCLAQSCCAEDEACGNDPQCLDAAMCMDNCVGPPGSTGRDAGPGGADAAMPDPTACLMACAQQYPTGSNELGALDNCLSATCGSACQ